MFNLDKKDLELISHEIPSFRLERDMVSNGINIIDLLSDKTTITNSKSEARRAIESNAISLNKDKISDISTVVQSKDLLHERFVMIENGKKNKYIVVFD